MTAPPKGRFLDLFAEEAEVRLRRLSEHVLLLESGTSTEIVGAILRDAHSLKGAAAVVGLNGVSTLAHRLEDVMEPFRAGTVAPPAEVVDRLLEAIDGLQSLLPAIRREEETAPTTDALSARLGEVTAADPSPASPAPAPTAVPPATPAPPPHAPAAPAPASAPVSASAAPVPSTP